MRIFINECSLHGQYRDAEHFGHAVREFMGIFALINEYKATSYKYSDVFLLRQAIEHEHFTASLSSLRDKSLKVAFRRIVFDRNNPKDWSLEQIHSEKDFFTCEEIDDDVTGTTLAEVAERQQIHTDVPHFVVNFRESCFAGKTQISVYKNDIEHTGTPIEVECFEEKAALAARLTVPEEPLSALLKNNSTRFQKTTYTVKGAVVYQEISTDYYWYADTFHSGEGAHFEVFTRKTHLGIAGTDLVLVADSAESAKDGKVPW